MSEWNPVAVLKLGEPPFAGRTRFLAEADRSIIAEVRCGVLFVMAFWSGTSRLSFGRLRKVLTELDPGGRLEVVVVDTDGCPDLYELPEFEGSLLGGNGETAWIANGQVIATTWGGSDPSAFEVFARHLLKEFKDAP